MKQYVDKFFEIAKKNKMVPKLVSILLAVILWAYISSTKSGDIKFKIPVSFRNLDNGLVVSKISQSNVIIKIYGKTEELKNTQVKNIRAFIDLRRAEAGKYRSYRVEYTKNEVPEGIDVDLNPEEVKVLVEKKVTKNIRIIPKYSGNAAQGYLIGKIKVVPDTVQVTGPESLLSDIAYIPTREISIDDRTETVREVVGLEAVEKDDLNYSLSKVRVVIPVISYSQIKTVEMPVELKNPGKGYRYSSEIENVKVHIMISDGRSIDDRGYSAYIDLSRTTIGPGDFTGSGEIKRDMTVFVKGGTSADSDDVISVTPDKIPVLIKKD